MDWRLNEIELGMDEKPNLKLLKRPAELKSANNFWRCCPLAKQYLPESICTDGKPLTDVNGKIVDEPRCEWWINSATHQYCFWRYVKDKSDVNGVMKELVQSELAALFGWSNTKTHFMLKQAIEELTQALKIHGAMELLEDLDADQADNIVVPDDFADTPSEDQSE